jgi:DNA polymerase I
MNLWSLGDYPDCIGPSVRLPARERNHFGAGPASWQPRTGKPEIVARQFLQHYREAYPVFWEWSENVQNHAVLYGWQQTVFGWTKSLPWEEDCNPRSLKNFPAQSNGAEILRLAVCLGIERGIKVVAQVHDSVMVEATSDKIKHDVEVMLGAMQEASRVVLSGFTLRVESKIIRYPHHYSDPRGDVMWRKVTGVLNGLK